MNKQRVQQIREQEQAAEAAEQDAEKHRWEAARLIAEELDSGTSTRELAEALGMSHVVVWKKAQCWRKFAVTPGVTVPRFWDMYREISDWSRDSKDQEEEPVAPSIPGNVNGGLVGDDLKDVKKEAREYMRDRALPTIRTMFHGLKTYRGRLREIDSEVDEDSLFTLDMYYRKAMKILSDSGGISDDEDKGKDKGKE